MYFQESSSLRVQAGWSKLSPEGIAACRQPDFYFGERRIESPYCSINNANRATEGESDGTCDIGLYHIDDERK
jgi:hypothetical protein